MSVSLSKEITDKILAPLGDNDGSGQWLRYDPVYDQIREAKREEDDGMVREGWETDLHHANWQDVESLCLRVLTDQSKDLQIFAWFIEARQNLYGFSGLLDSTKILLDFIKTFWEKFHPKISEDPDQTFRTHIIEAMLRNLQTLVLTEPLSELGILFSQPPSLAKCYEADNLEKFSKKGPEAAEAFQQALNNGLITMDRIRKAFHEVYKDIGEKKVETIDACLVNLQETEKFLSDSIGPDSPRFTDLISYLTELKGLYKLCERTTEKSLDSEEEKTAANLAEGEQSELHEENGDKITDRAGVYQAIRNIGEFLFTLDPHSPSPVLLRLIGGWENKNLAEMLTDLQTASPEIRSLLTLFGSACQLNQNNQPPKE